jgi:hypothetical protein
MVLQWLGWPHRADGDGGGVPDVTTWPWASAEQASVPLRGFRRLLSRARCPGCTGVDGIVPRNWPRPYRTSPHSGGDGLTGGVGGTVPGRDSQARQGRGMDSSLTWAPANVTALNTLVGGAGAEAASPRGPRARRNLTRGWWPPLERGGTSPKGATGPRARRNPARGSAQPPSEAEVCPCGAAPLERSGVLLEGGWAVCLVGHRGHQGRGPSRWAVSFVLSVFWVRLRFVFYERKWVFPSCLGDLYGCPRHYPYSILSELFNKNPTYPILFIFIKIKYHRNHLKFIYITKYYYKWR